jgi:hypothetical protein
MLVLKMLKKSCTIKKKSQEEELTQTIHNATVVLVEEIRGAELDQQRRG